MPKQRHDELVRLICPECTIEYDILPSLRCPCGNRIRSITAINTRRLFSLMQHLEAGIARGGGIAEQTILYDIPGHTIKAINIDLAIKQLLQHPLAEWDHDPLRIISETELSRLTNHRKRVY